MKNLKVVAILSILLFLAGCDGKKEAQNETNSHEEKSSVEKVKNEPIVLTSLNGESLTFDIKDNKNVIINEIKDKVVLINFFATWCPPCKAEIPHLIDLQEKYKDSLQIIAISLDKDKTKEDMQNFSSSFHINYFVNFGESSFNFEKKIGGVQTIPMMLMYDKNGKYYTHYSGAVPQEMIEVDIKKAMKK